MSFQAYRCGLRHRIRRSPHNSRREAMRQVLRLGLVVLAFLAAAADGQAQTLGTIAGVVKDTSGAVLPGTSVEVSSPLLIEKARTAVTDSSGQYAVIHLPPR